MNKPWTTAQFEHNRSHMCEWCRKEIIPLIENKEYRFILITAPVKSGKREFSEYIAMRDKGIASPREHIFISAWYRKADEEQRKELSLHNMKVFSINKKDTADECISYIDEKVKQEKEIILHLDECDHGSGENQILSKIYKYIRDIQQVFSLLYSATPQEVLFSSDITNQDEKDMLDDILLRGINVEYIPPPGYCGPSRFLNENLVYDAKPFFTMKPIPSLTEQGRQIINDLKKSTLDGKGRNIMTLRLTKKDGRKKEDKEIYLFLKNKHKFPELKDIQILVDKSDCSDIDNSRKIEWSNRSFWTLITKDIPIIIVHDQSSSRSTEWNCHDRIFATHDYRTTLTYSIISQAQERVNHYDTKYESGFQPIYIYGHKKTFELSSKFINYEQYFEHEWSIRKIKRSVINDVTDNMYEIINKYGEIHSQYNYPLTKKNAENILKDLGCFGDLTLSSRINGKICKLPIFDTYWFPCSSDNFNECIKNHINNVFNGKFKNYSFNNPFSNNRRSSPDINGHEKGYLREWKVFDYDKDIKTQPGWGVVIGKPRLTICYCQNVLGVAIRWNTGNFKEVNRLSAYCSMYPSK